ncbi:MAG: hypothetical protein QXH10_10680 [Ignisphaera sp.]
MLSYDIQMFWLPNPADPFALSFKCRRASDTKIIILFLHDLIEIKMFTKCSLFLYRFYQAINSRYINSKNYVLKVVRWGEQNLLAPADVLVHKLRQKWSRRYSATPVK